MDGYAPKQLPRTESVWDYPRPPAVKRSGRHVTVEVDGYVIADSRRAIRCLETSHPPTWYIPAEDVRVDLLFPTGAESLCEFKGKARYFGVDTGTRRIEDVAWTYPRPWAGYASVGGHYCFYPSRVDACFVDGERVQAQEGDFYGGWITSEVRGPFKGGAGTRGW
jgi:uncharacterized protein (DUF427 family)